MGETFGLPLHCPKCPPKRYYGILKGENAPQRSVKTGRSDVCPNCKTQLVGGRETFQRSISAEVGHSGEQDQTGSQVRATTS